MTRKEAKEMLPIIQAYAEGKAIQIKKEGDWLEVGKNTEVYFSESPSDYRIKPEPKYRPFRTQEECWEEMQKHQPFGWVKRKGVYVNITLVSDSSDYDRYFKTANFVDGTPFGIKEV